jgi:hypothetical protein
MTTYILLSFLLTALCVAFLVRAANTFISGRKYVHFSYLKRPIIRNAIFGIAIIPVIVLVRFLVPVSEPQQDQVRIADPAFLFGDYNLTSAKGKMIFAMEGEAPTISIQYKNGAKLTGTYLVTSLDSTTEQTSFILNISGQWTQKKKLQPYEHSFVGVLKDGSLTLTSTADQSVIAAVRKANP